MGTCIWDRPSDPACLAACGPSGDCIARIGIRESSHKALSFHPARVSPIRSVSVPYWYSYKLAPIIISGNLPSLAALAFGKSLDSHINGQGHFVSKTRTRRRDRHAAPGLLQAEGAVHNANAKVVDAVQLCGPIMVCASSALEEHIHQTCPQVGWRPGY